MFTSTRSTNIAYLILSYLILFYPCICTFKLNIDFNFFFFTESHSILMKFWLNRMKLELNLNFVLWAYMYAIVKKNHECSWVIQIYILIIQVFFLYRLTLRKISTPPLFANSKTFEQAKKMVSKYELCIYSKSLDMNLQYSISGFFCFSVQRKWWNWDTIYFWTKN